VAVLLRIWDGIIMRLRLLPFGLYHAKIKIIHIDAAALASAMKMMRLLAAPALEHALKKDKNII
jgi:hypothetical protein